ncbi:Cation/H+ exchanger [Mycena floridula]|nr:Cation/H+ exchanger [Mycena floridula]
MTTIQYQPPDQPTLLTIASFLFFNSLSENLFQLALNAGLIGPLVVGIIYGPQVANILPEYLAETFIVLGYIGLILLVFEGGLITNIDLLTQNIGISMLAGTTGIVLPITISILLLHFGYGYSALQGFAAGAALCSTSLGTTMSLLKPEFRQTKVGVVLISAAIFDDVVALIIASIIEQITASSAIQWQTIVRPILVSFAFILVTTVGARLLRPFLSKFTATRLHFFVMPPLICGFVAGSKYAGGSELFGAYLAGLSITYVFPKQDPHKTAFEIYLQPVQNAFLSPLFFASIGFALPIRALGSVDGSSRVVWRGIVYSLLMMLGKMAVGLWALVWNQETEILTRSQSSLILGLSLVPRGEIAIIVAQLARPLLILGDSSESEQFSVVFWAILLNTIGGAVGVGLILNRIRSQSHVIIA